MHIWKVWLVGLSIATSFLLYKFFVCGRSCVAIEVSRRRQFGEVASSNAVYMRRGLLTQPPDSEVSTSHGDGLIGYECSYPCKKSGFAHLLKPTSASPYILPPRLVLLGSVQRYYSSLGELKS